MAPKMKAEKPAETTDSNILLLKARCEGISPLMMDRMTRTTLIQTLFHGQKAVPDKSRKPHEVCMDKIYHEFDGEPDREGEGRVGIPMENLFAAMRKAGQGITYEKRENITKATGETKLPGFLSILTPFLLLTANGEEASDEHGVHWQVDARRGMMKATGGSGTAVCIVRPKFHVWEFEVEMLFEPEAQVSEATIKQILTKAGNSIGLCSFRPTNGGPFGRFRVASWESRALTEEERDEILGAQRKAA